MSVEDGSAAEMTISTMYTSSDDWKRKLRPFSEMPVWALMRFQKRIPETYFWEQDKDNPRKMSEVTALGCMRMSENLVFVSFFMEWIIDDHFVIIYYTMPLVKPPS
jgi:hypothetical protein